MSYPALLPPQMSVMAERDIRSRSIKLYFRGRCEGMVSIMAPVSIMVMPESEEPLDTTPSFSLDVDTAQELMGELYNAGIRIARDFQDGEKGAMIKHIAALEGEIAFLRSLVQHREGIVT